MLNLFSFMEWILLDYNTIFFGARRACVLPAFYLDFFHLYSYGELFFFFYFTTHFVVVHVILLCELGKFTSSYWLQYLEPVLLKPGHVWGSTQTFFKWQISAPGPTHSRSFSSVQCGEYEIFISYRFPGNADAGHRLASYTTFGNNSEIYWNYWSLESLISRFKFIRIGYIVLVISGSFYFPRQESMFIVL